MQYTYKLDLGRIGVSLEVMRVSDGDAPTVPFRWEVNLNSKVIRISRHDAEGNEVMICDHSSFMFPDDVTEEEVDLAKFLSGGLMPEDGPLMELCSLLSAKYSAGHDEESFHKVITGTLNKWKS